VNEVVCLNLRQLNPSPECCESGIKSTATISGGWHKLDFKVVYEGDLSAYSEVVDSNVVMDDLQYFIEYRRPI
jgi:hypothetical protein